jgi:hypothetical protein
LANRSAGSINEEIDYEGNPNDITQESVWNGMRIGLESFNGRPEVWLQFLKGIAGSIAPNDVNSVQEMSTALLAERRHFREHLGSLEAVVVESFFNDIERRMQRRKP